MRLGCVRKSSLDTMERPTVGLHLALALCQQEQAMATPCVQSYHCLHLFLSSLKLLALLIYS